MSRIYIETTIPSFYYEVRTDATTVARRQWTREWFDMSILFDEIVTSAAVLDELERGTFPGRADAILLIQKITPLQITEDIRQIVREYIDRKLMPAGRPRGHSAGLNLRCDFAQIVRISGSDLF